ncbi:hypothetical protein EUGRSUZ_J00515 [Eucalyptus grandis]|uniref:Uncharacterized protein n=2 Tax=Eucalyptus grandis TaxID=71139 RepID=A0ACC3J3Q2_EUCGR|nr:hypothetical protein EUGRSUZ_J00515 [Eucalyptus grandis]
MLARASPRARASSERLADAHLDLRHRCLPRSAAASARSSERRYFARSSECHDQSSDAMLARASVAVVLAQKSLASRATTLIIDYLVTM